MNSNIQIDWISDKVCVVCMSRLFIISLACQLDNMVVTRKENCTLKEDDKELNFLVKYDDFLVNTSANVINIYAEYDIFLNLSNSLKSFLFYEDHGEKATVNRLDISLELYGATFMPSFVKDVVIEDMQLNAK